MRTSVQWNDAHIMNHFDKNHHVTRALYDPVIVVVARIQHRRARAEHHETSIVEVIGFRRIPPAYTLPPLDSFGGPRLALGRHRRDSSIRRIENQRRTEIMRERILAAVQTKLREVVMHIGDSPGRGLLGFGLRCPLFHFFRFLLRIELLGHALGPFERDVCVVCPKALQVWLAVRRAWRFVCFGYAHGFIGLSRGWDPGGYQQHD